MTEAEYDAVYKAAEAKIVAHYEQLQSAAEKDVFFKKVARLYSRSASTMALLSILVNM